MFNLRFKLTILFSIFDAFKEIPQANKMIADKDRYSLEERFAYAKLIMDNMRKKARCETDVYGKENIPTDSNFIIYSNHQGKYDALGILLALEKPCSVLWAKKTADTPLSRQVCGLLDAVVIDLENPRDIVNSIKAVNAQIKDGRNILIFPEGGYTDNKNNLIEFKTGCFSCSVQTGAPILPVAVYDSYKAMNSNTYEKVRTQVHFLKPIYREEFEGMNKKQLADFVKGRIEEKMSELRAAKA